MLGGEHLDKAVAALVESDVFDFMAEDCSQLIFTVHIRQNAASNEDLASRQADRALESRTGIETKTIRKFALCVGSDPVAYGLQILFDFRGLRSRPHSLFLRKFVRKNLTRPDLIRFGYGDWSRGVLRLR